MIEHRQRNTTARFEARLRRGRYISAPPRLRVSKLRTATIARRITDMVINVKFDW